MFYGVDPKTNKYRLTAHLAEMIALLGPPPPKFVSRSGLRDVFFDEKGEVFRCYLSPGVNVLS